jgi:hypothetical protein
MVILLTTVIGVIAGVSGALLLSPERRRRALRVAAFLALPGAGALTGIHALHGGSEGVLAALCGICCAIAAFLVVLYRARGPV